LPNFIIMENKNSKTTIFLTLSYDKLKVKLPKKLGVIL